MSPWWLAHADRVTGLQGARHSDNFRPGSVRVVERDAALSHNHVIAVDNLEIVVFHPAHPCRGVSLLGAYSYGPDSTDYY